MKTQVFLYCITFLLLIGSNPVFSGPPHIIYILVDDLGWNDISFHGSVQIPTPNIDSLAYSGVILNNYYVQTLCTPSRGALMTGKYPIRLGLQHYVISASEPWGLSPEEKILPQYLKELGYATRGIGKWHLGFFEHKYLPTNRGFDSFFGYWNGKEDYYTHFEEEGELSGLDFHDDAENAWNYTGYYATEAFTERAKQIIKKHDSSKPLFLYVAHQAVHAGNGYSPLQAPLDYVKKFSHIKDENRRVFAGMTSALDKSVGEIFSTLDEANMLENSVIVFSTDNGGAVEGIDESTGSNWPLRGSKYTLWEGGIRGTAFVWSPLLNKSKGYTFRNLMHVTDWLPTLYAAAGGNPEKSLGSIDGYNLWPSLTQNLTSPRDHILHNIDPEWKVEAILKGQYKLITGTVMGGDFDGWFDKEGKKKKNKLFDKEELSAQNKVYQKFLQDSEVMQTLKKKHSDSGEYCYSENDATEVKESKCNGEEKPSLPFATPVQVDCGVKPENASGNCQPTKEYCLFDIENDPCEYNNLAHKFPSIVQHLKEILDEYRSQAVPIRNKPSDPASNPKYYGYSWVPWTEKDVKKYFIFNFIN